MNLSFRLLSVLGYVIGWTGGWALVLVLRVLVQHRLGVTSTRSAAVDLVRELVLLVGRAILWLVWLRVGASHGRHFAWISKRPT